MNISKIINVDYFPTPRTQSGLSLPDILSPTRTDAVTCLLFPCPPVFFGPHPCKLSESFLFLSKPPLTIPSSTFRTTLGWLLLLLLGTLHRPCQDTAPEGLPANKADTLHSLTYMSVLFSASVSPPLRDFRKSFYIFL